jgi:hypothetical protein
MRETERKHNVSWRSVRKGSGLGVADAAVLTAVPMVAASPVAANGGGP